MPRHVHAQLPASQSAIEDVLRVFVSLEDGVQQALAVVEVLAHAPFLHADDVYDLLVGPLQLEGGDKNVAAAEEHVPAGEGADDPPDVDVLQVTVLADEVEDDPATLVVAEAFEFGIGVAGRRAVENRVEHQFALVDVTTGQPLHLHEELGAHAQQKLLGNRLVGLAEQRRRTCGSATARSRGRRGGTRG